MSDIPRELQELADSLAEMKVAAWSSAISTIVVMMLDLLIRKGVVTRDELLVRLAEIEKTAAEIRVQSPMSSEATLELCLRLRHAFDPTGGSQKPS
jgi:hypothetical protein